MSSLENTLKKKEVKLVRLIFADKFLAQHC